MKAKAAVLVALLFLVGSIPVAQSSSGPQSIAIGKLSWTRSSVCELPQYPGMFLQYYLTDGCNRTLFLYGNLRREMTGSTIWAEGTMVENGGCKILVINSFSLCSPATPGDLLWPGGT